MSTAHLPPAEYYATLPKIIGGAGAGIHDAAGRVLLVKTSYGDGWEVPGGGLDLGEDPRQAVQREVKEELGMDLTPGRLLIVDWVPEQPDGRPPLVNFIFDGGLITEEEAQQRVHLDTDEITVWKLAAPDEWDTLLPPHMARRLHACARALTHDTTLYLHHGFDPTRHQT
ncbi:MULTISPECIES: NUDIX hydrolase [unclassified Streptomyces]|uniref:NUDIX hydrolase n=1 Tax=unclassified Streptomyces TaxID=2593676 RepID=UPI002E77B7A9|nr:NUDIX hydrolase [Streptomyces sp. JV185]MEE1767145.1 NUDIX hydrolase [Streptomyces sp. JV185]